MGYIRNAVLIATPVDEVFRLTNDVRTWTTLFTEYEASEVLEETETSVTFRLTTRPDADGKQWSWVAKRETDLARRSTYSERLPSAGPFERMVIRWWYDSVGDTSTVMTWEQEFEMKAQAPITEADATDYLNRHTRLQQWVIKEKVEQIVGNAQQTEDVYRGIILARYKPGSEEAIVDAFRRSDATELPDLIGVKSRHVWVLGDIYVHFVEGKAALPTVLKEYSDHPLFQSVKAELDQYVSPLAPNNQAVAKEIYSWRPGKEVKEPVAATNK